MMPTYNKLVRDRIPEIISNTGKSYRTTILSQEEYVQALQAKASEELAEYLASPNDEEGVEELADLLEIIHSLAEAHGATVQQLEEVRQRKAEKRGGFKERIFLVDVEDE